MSASLSWVRAYRPAQQRQPDVVSTISATNTALPTSPLISLCTPIGVPYCAAHSQRLALRSAFTDLVLDDSDALLVALVVEDVVEEGGLTRAEEAGDDRERNLRGHAQALRRLRGNVTITKMSAGFFPDFSCMSYLPANDVKAARPEFNRLLHSLRMPRPPNRWKLLCVTLMLRRCGLTLRTEIAAGLKNEQ